MYLIEFEQAKNGDTTVRLMDPDGLLAETTYHGNPPGLELGNSDGFALLRLPPAGASERVDKKEEG